MEWLGLLIFYGLTLCVVICVAYGVNKRRARELEAQAQMLVLLQEIREELRLLSALE